MFCYFIYNVLIIKPELERNPFFSFGACPCQPATCAATLGNYKESLDFLEDYLISDRRVFRGGGVQRLLPPLEGGLIT